MLTIKIKAASKFSLNLKELWEYRELFYVLALRDVKVRYKQTVIGILWAILQPFITMVVFSVFFGGMAGIAPQNVPYPIFVYTGLVFWNYFSQSLSAASDRLVNEQALIQKVYFPRLIMPFSATIVFLIDFIFAGSVLLGLMFYYRITPSLVGILLIIPCLIVTFLVSSGLGLFLSAANVRYRDIRYVLPFFIQLLLFVTPVIYTTDILGKYKWFWYFNPIGGVIDTMRSVLLGVSNINWGLFAAAAIFAVLLFMWGVFYFKKAERNFADVI